MSASSFRVTEFGLIEVLVPSIVTWGLHNDVVCKDAVGAGFLFNSLDMTGSWHDVTPLVAKHEKRHVIERIWEAIPAKDVDKLNQKNHVIIERVYDNPRYK